MHAEHTATFTNWMHFNKVRAMHISAATVEEWTVEPLHWSLCARAFCITHVISIFSGSQLHFQANKNPELAGGSQ